MIHVSLGGRRYAGIVEEIVGTAMGWIHGYYARYAVETGVARVAVLHVDGRTVGVEVFYKASLGPTEACIHYYVVVRPEEQGKGYGKLLVLSVEEACDASAYVATVAGWNQQSIGMFESLCYTGFTWEELEEEIGWERTRVLMEATCGYEDDIVFVKPASAVEEWGRLRLKSPRGLWRRICWEPWAKLYY